MSEAKIHRSSQDCLSSDLPKSRVDELVVLAVWKGEISIRAVISGIELNYVNWRVKTTKRQWVENNKLLYLPEGEINCELLIQKFSSLPLAAATNANQLLCGFITFTRSNIIKSMYFIGLTMTYVYNPVIFYNKGLRLCPVLLHCRKLRVNLRLKKPPDKINLLQNITNRAVYYYCIILDLIGLKKCLKFGSILLFINSTSEGFHRSQPIDLNVKQVLFLWRILKQRIILSLV